MQKIINALQMKNLSFNEVLMMSLLYLIIEILNTLTDNYFEYYFGKNSKLFSAKIDETMLKKALTFSVKDFENANTYDLINKAKMQNSQGILFFFQEIIEVLKLIVSILSTVSILFLYNIIFAFIVLLIPVIKCIYTIKLNEEQFDAITSRVKESRKVWYIDYLIMTGNAFKEIIINNIGGFLVNTYSSLRKKFNQEDIKIQKKLLKNNVYFCIFQNLVIGAIFLYTIYLGFLGELLIGDVSTYTNCIYNILASVEACFLGGSNLIQESLYIKLFYDFINLNVDTNCKEDFTDIKIDSIEIKNLSYKYNGKYVLKSINLKITSKTPLAILGKNGSGKTTLIKIIAGLYDDYEGNVLVNGKELKTLNKKHYYKHIGCVFQDFVKFETSLRKNIGFGNLSSMYNDEEIWDVLESVKLKKVFSDTKDLELSLGSWFGTTQVSLGEWQKIAIARSLLKKADVYLLDEPDASLDVLAEKSMLKLYKDLSQNKLTVFVTHKVEQVKDLTNDIIVLNKGEIVERGNHCDLLKKKGLYSDLYYKIDREQ